MNSKMSIPPAFHPLIARWFRDNIGDPTDVQTRAWPKIIAGDNILISAPTGSGKTLTAFMWAIHKFVEGSFKTGFTRVLYVSPLKALNYDIQRNLLGPLSELRELFQSSGKIFPEIRVLTRSGDTPASVRRQMQRHPPEILITTPESLNLLLSAQGSRPTLRHLSTVVLDEIHAVVGNKRGVHLITAVERLVRLSGEFQRIALSATIKPLKVVARFVGGYKIDGDVPDPRYTPRPVTIIKSPARKSYDIRVKLPEERPNRSGPDSIWESLAQICKKMISLNRSTLIFVNSRRLCEKLTLIINNNEDPPLAYAHHGSLSREIRSEVEKKFKCGKLKAIVATNSLELGIDIGTLDEVVLIQSPFSIMSAIQRIGRAGHQVNEVSRGVLLPTHSRDFIESAVLALKIHQQDIETVKPVQCPLDVLAQIIVSMTTVDKWNIDDLYANLKTSHPYRRLTRRQFELVLNMLNGRYAVSRIRELKPRVFIDRIDNTVIATKGARMVLYTSGGTIPDRGYFNLRHLDTNARIGDLDEEFVWEARVGQIFTLGTQNWQIQRITHNDVFVTPAAPKAASAPFWKGEENGRNFHFAECIGLFLEEANNSLEYPEFAAELCQNYKMDEAAAANLIGFLKKQKEISACDLPHRHHLLIEFSSRGPGATPGNQIVLHTLWGGQVNRPFALALDAAWEDHFGQRIEIFAGNDCVVLLQPHEITGKQLLSLLKGAQIETLLRRRLEGSGFFGARFRECAGRALLITRTKVNERLPLWVSRLRSQRLLEAVQKYADFPILLEAWRSCLQDEFDLKNLQRVLSEMESGQIRWTEVKTGHPSPMAQSVSWSQISHYMYMDDTPTTGRASRLRSDLLNELVYTPSLRPTVSSKLVEQFELKRQRLQAGYSPQTPLDLLEWVKERLLIPVAEFQRLLQAVKDDHKIDRKEFVQSVAAKLVILHPPAARQPLVTSLELPARIIDLVYDQDENVKITSFDSSGYGAVTPHTETALSDEDRNEALASLIGQWLGFYGPLSVKFCYATLGIQKDRLKWAINDLLETNRIINGQLIKGNKDNLICDSQNFEMLLRLSRADALPAIQPLSIEMLQLFLVKYQGFMGINNNIDELYRCMEKLLCHPLNASIWEKEIFPSRLSDYDPYWLDTIIREGEVIWLGRAKQKVAFCLKTELNLMQADINDRQADNNNSFHRNPILVRDQAQKKTTRDKKPLFGLFEDDAARYDFAALMRKSNLKVPDLVDRLWQAVWQGQVSTDSFATLRRGIGNQFKIPNVAEMPVRQGKRRRSLTGRYRFKAWKSALPYGGNWFRLTDAHEQAEDLIEIEERKKDRVRILLDRYGILFRELLDRELPEFRWPAIFRSLRLMELSGEILTGYFFNSIPGLQFISPQALRMLRNELSGDFVYWINAADPVSLCGTQIDPLRTSLPKRIASTHLVFCGSRLVLVSRRNAKALDFRVPANDPRIREYLCSLRHLLTRRFKPLRHISIETVNGIEAARSEYVTALKTSFDVMISYKKVALYRKS